MIAITGWQHIFTSVERERSPTRQRGYQTLFHSAEGLSADDLRVLESRAQYYSTPGEPVKRQFYWLPGDRWVVSQAVALAEPDQFGRKGRYLSHSLVFPLEAWQQAEAAPFGVWMADPFVRRLDQAFEQGSMDTGHIPPRVVGLAPGWRDSALAHARRWQPDALLGLMTAVEQARALASAGQPLAIAGSQEGIGEVLLICFLLALPEQRRFLTFDTHASGCNWGSQEGFWAVGFPGAAEARSPWRVEADSRRPQVQAMAPATSGPYRQWLELAIRRGALDNLAAQQGWALALEGLLQGRPLDRRLLEEMDGEFLEQFASLNAAHVRRCLLDLLPRGLPDPLAQRALAHLGPTAREQLQELVRGLSRADMNDILYELLLADAQPWSLGVQQSLAPVVHEHPGLRRMLALWSGNLPAWRTELDRLPTAEYAALVEALLVKRSLPSWKTLSPRHIDDWFRVAGPYTVLSDILAVAQALNECGGGPAVERLAAWVPHAAPEDLRPLQAWLSKAFKNKPPRLWQTLEKKIGGPPSAIDRIRSLLLGPD